MRIRPLTTCIVAAAISAAPLALGAPAANPMDTKFKSVFNFALGTTCDPSGTFCHAIAALVYDDEYGVLQGHLESEYYTPQAKLSYVHCTGPAYASALSLNPEQGTLTINATLDPSAPGCEGFNSSSLIVNITGKPAGTFHRGSTATTVEEYPDHSIRFTNHSDQFDETFTGTNGLFTGVFSGFVFSSRNTDRAKTK